VIIFGDRYTFTSYERERLLKQTSNITYITRHDHTDQETIQYIERTIQETRSKIIVLNLENHASRELISFLTHLELQGVTFYTFERFMERYLHKCFISKTTEDLRYLQDIRPFHLGIYGIKRTLDYIGALSLVLLTLPVMIFAILKIKQQSKGPILFKQSRVGQGGKLFTCYKFRSMHVDSHFDPYTRENDTRIFPFGNLMRKTRIDELPQLWNVLKGDMHLIGPRAEWNILVEGYEKELPYYTERHLIKPGITGWAQVNYPYGANIEDTHQKLMYDLYYIKEWSLLLELKTALKTIQVMLKGKGT